MTSTKKNNLESYFSPSDVQIIEKSEAFSGFFKVLNYRFKHKLYAGGWSPEIKREMFERGHAAALLPYDAKTDQVVLIEQIRVGALEHAHPWQIEIVAGMIDKQEASEEVVKREAQEEAGIDIGLMEKITSYYPSSGACSEKLDVFVGQTDASTAKGLHGLEEEGEDIRVIVMSRQEAYKMVESGVIENGASIIALQWLQLNHLRLREQWQ